MMTAPLGTGRVNRYVMVRSSTSSDMRDVPYNAPSTGTMNRRYKSQIMPPKTTGPGTGTPLILNDDSPISEMTRNSTAMTTGAPVASAMNTVRRDHNI